MAGLMAFARPAGEAPSARMAPSQARGGCPQPELRIFPGLRMEAFELVEMAGRLPPALR